MNESAAIMVQPVAHKRGSTSIMENRSGIIAETEQFVFDLFKQQLPEGLVYHTFSHSKTVADTAAELAARTELGEDGIEVVTLAALLHDTGYTELYNGHEEISIRIAREYLERKRYSEERIELIAGCIRATKVPQAPKNILEEIVADADLASLGRKLFFKQSQLLRIEWERFLHKQYSDEEWNELSIDLLTRHTFHTKVAQQVFADQQHTNLRKLYKLRQSQSKTTEAEIPAVMEAPVAEVSAKATIDGTADINSLLLLITKRQLGEHLALNNRAILLSICAIAIVVVSFWMPIIALLWISCSLSLCFSILALFSQSRPAWIDRWDGESLDAQSAVFYESTALEGVLVRKRQYIIVSAVTLSMGILITAVLFFGFSGHY